MNHSAYIVRHRKENVKKCSLRYIEQETDRFRFFTYPTDCLSLEFDLPTECFLLHIDGEELKSSETEPLVLLDGTWRYSEVMYRMIPSVQRLPKRSLPSGWRTAYPRRQPDCSDPTRGLASLEALYIAFLITGRKTDDLLNGYYWKERFLEINNNLIKKYI